MAFITNEKRESLISKVNQSYAVKKLIVLVEILALITFIVLTFVSLYNSNKNGTWQWFQESLQEGKDVYSLTALGIGMTIYAVLLGILGIVSVVLVFTIKSPKTVKKEIKTLESSALSGKRIKKSETAGDIMRERRNPTIANPNYDKKGKKGK